MTPFPYLDGERFRGLRHAERDARVGVAIAWATPAAFLWLIWEVFR